MKAVKFAKTEFPLKPYAAFAGPFFFDSNDTRQVVEGTFEELKSKVKAESDILKALKISAKMAILYGVPGLLYHVQLIENLVEQEKERAATVSHIAVDALKWLLLAEKLVGEDTLAYKMLKHYLPGDAVDNKNYFSDKKKEIIDKGDLTETDIKMCERGAEYAFEQCEADVRAHSI
jgi:hypothetical protein